jgi:acetylornithine deacetylase/succinyl-diaminopimelate desuccinylase-like protein
MPDARDWKAATAETVGHLSRLIRIDTTNPPGNELPAILEIRDILTGSGFRPEGITIVPSAPNRANLVARLRGDGSMRPLLLSGHVDVVAAERQHWSHDPFGGDVIDGEVWGRGALDMKGFLAMYLQVFLEAHRRRTIPKRDLILAAVADEENGFAHGSKLLVDEHRELIDAEYGLTEGGAMTVPVGAARVYPIGVAEKGVCWLRMTARGRPGHGSIPHGDNAVFHLVRALDRLRRARHLPVHLSEPYRLMITAVARQARFPFGALAGLLRSRLVVRLLLRAAKGRAGTILTAMTTNTVSPTILAAGAKTNVIPSVAEAHIDCRALPGQTSDDVMRDVLAVAGPNVQLEVLHTTAGTAFPIQTPFYRLLERATRRMDPKALVTPMMSPGATDACHYQRAGIIVYGFTPGVLPDGFPFLALAHGHDERLPVSFIESGLPALWEVVAESCAMTA